MELKPDFSFRPLPPIPGSPRSLTEAPTNPLGVLQDLPGTWTGKGFNTIWRPNSVPGQDRFLELNLTQETIEFQAISGDIPNRGLLQGDIVMHGVTYLQQIKDANNKAGLHIEPGIWATVPNTTNPLEAATVVRMASIPHGTTILLQGNSIPPFNGGPKIQPTNITPFVIGDPTNTINFPEVDLSTPTPFRSPPGDIDGVTQAMVDDPNSVLVSAIAGQTIVRTIVLSVSSSLTAPLIGGGLANTAFLQGDGTAGPNAQAAIASAIFWIETVKEDDGSECLQLQYTQSVMLNFNGLSWPHITVGTLRKQ